MNQERHQPRLNSAYEAVVIGAGLGGLSTAVELARRGCKVLLLEQHNLPGGFASSFVRGRFEFEPSLHELCDIGSATNPGSVRHFLENIAGVQLDWCEIPEAYRLILTQEGLNVRLPFGVSAFIDTIEQHVPGSKAALTRYMELCQEVQEAFAYLSAAKGRPDIRKLLRQHLNFLRTAGYSMAEVTEAMGVSPAAQKLLYPYWCYIGIPASRAPFCWWAAMLFKYISLGAYIPRFRSHELAMALVRRIEALGGRVEFNTRVEQILVENGRVRGITTNQGDEVTTDCVIANASPTLVYNQLIRPASAVPTLARKLINARRHAMSAFVVYLGLDRSADDLNIHDYSYFISDRADTEEIYQNFSQLTPPKMQASVCLNRAIPDASPPGTTILSLTTLFDGEIWGKLPPNEYGRTKQAIAAGMIQEFEQATGCTIRDHIEEIEIATPVTLARYTGGYHGGVYGYEQDLWDSVIPRAKALRQENHITGLYFSGGYATFGHGYSSSITSGKTTANLAQISREVKK